ncbi:helix-turn-helix domain-containing protein [Streptomyces althioticus]
MAELHEPRFFEDRRAGQMNLGSMDDLTADITREKRERIDAIKAEMIDAERGHELASLRKAQGLTQTQVAKAMGVTQGRVSQIERGAARLDTSTMAAYLHAIGGELTITATVGNLSVRLWGTPCTGRLPHPPPARPRPHRPCPLR